MAKILTLLENGFVDVEFSYPAKALKKAGHDVLVASSKKDIEIESKQGTKVISDSSYEGVNPQDFDALFVPGGKSPEKVRLNKAAIEIVKSLASSNKIIAAICHGPQVLATAGVLRGKTVTSWPLIQDELRDVGAKYVNQEVVVDGNFITSRNPGDIASFTKTLLTQLG